jgi:hypothetical protein
MATAFARYGGNLFFLPFFWSYDYNVRLEPNILTPTLWALDKHQSEVWTNDSSLSQEF